MRNFILSTIAAAGVLISGAAEARDYAVALSPYGDKAAVKKQVMTVAQYLTENLQPGDTAILLNGDSLSTIGTFTVPDKPAYKHPKAKFAANKAVIGALMQFADNASGASVAGTVRLPQLLQHIAGNLSPAEEMDAMDVIVLASPLYHDNKDPAFSMTGELVPSDGHLTAGRDKTPFAASDPALLAKLRVHIGTEGEGWAKSDLHRHFVQRFWTLYIEKQGGKLVTFTGDLPTLFQRVTNKAEAPKHDYVLEPSDKLEMIRLVVKTGQSIFERSVTTVSLPADQAANAEGVELGISWNCQSCDLDIHARPHNGAETLFFGHSASKEGVYLKDYRISPRTIKGYETIVFNAPVDLRQLRIAINFYEGNAPQGVKGELRLSVNGATYAAPFTITATTGNKGAGAESTIASGKAASSQWIVIDPMSVVQAK